MGRKDVSRYSARDSILKMSAYFRWLMVFSFFIFMMIFCVVALMITERGVLKSPAIIVDLSVYPDSSVSFASCILKSFA
jgi:hypothetical protein